MSNKIWLTNGKYVEADDLVELMFRDRSYAASIILKIKCDKQKELATRTLLALPTSKRSFINKTTNNQSLAEEIFHDFTFGIFE